VPLDLFQLVAQTVHLVHELFFASDHERDVSVEFLEGTEVDGHVVRERDIGIVFEAAEAVTRNWHHYCFLINNIDILC
jgi:hypothetical protein